MRTLQYTGDAPKIERPAVNLERVLSVMEKQLDATKGHVDSARSFGIVEKQLEILIEVSRTLIFVHAGTKLTEYPRDGR